METGRWYNIPGETGRWYNIPRETGRWYNIPREDRTCNFCGNGIGDEFHILFLCENEIVVILRNKYIPNYYRIHPSYFKLVGLHSICNSQLHFCI